MRRGGLMASMSRREGLPRFPLRKTLVQNSFDTRLVAPRIELELWVRRPAAQSSNRSALALVP